jgi:hypothetical protein
MRKTEDNEPFATEDTEKKARRRVMLEINNQESTITRYILCVLCGQFIQEMNYERKTCCTNGGFGFALCGGGDPGADQAGGFARAGGDGDPVG